MGQPPPPPSEPAGAPQSLHSMGLLLDKLAKENQEIRLMQAELQAQKEELQTLLHKNEGEAAVSSSQQQSLTQENARLQELLHRESAALRATQAELHLLREKPGDAEPRQPLEVEVQRLHSLLASVHRDLEGALRRAAGSKGAGRLRAQLGPLEQRLAQELQPERAGAAEPPWRERGKKRSCQKQHEGHREGSPGRERREQHSGHKTPKAAGNGSPRQDARQRPWDAKQRPGKQRGPLAEHSALWEMLMQRQYPAPQGCASVADCARREGLTPVQKAGFLQLVHSYLEKLSCTGHYPQLAAVLDAFFWPDGTFAHNRLRFEDLLEELEEVLEALARQQGRDGEEADDFEEFVLRQLQGVEPGGR
uniref:Pre-B-cell leukemia transcription factor-interacting protein 1 n=1 Tax=Sphenodon punctatus TaxID=8508 RepID=A0A8D0G8N6_SPHPU